ATFSKRVVAPRKRWKCCAGDWTKIFSLLIEATSEQRYLFSCLFAEDFSHKKGSHPAPFFLSGGDGWNGPRFARHLAGCAALD
ncbi:MAG: hypothetical protein AAFN50_01020, partial [Pseudomonadota bacterium]